MSKRSGFYPCPAVDTAGSRVVSQAGGVLLTETVRTVGLDRALSGELAVRGASRMSKAQLLQYHRVAGAEIGGRADASMERFGLTALCGSPSHLLSG